MTGKKKKRTTTAAHTQREEDQKIIRAINQAVDEEGKARVRQGGMLGSIRCVQSARAVIERRCRAHPHTAAACVHRVASASHTVAADTGSRSLLPPGMSARRLTPAPAPCLSMGSITGLPTPAPHRRDPGPRQQQAARPLLAPPRRREPRRRCGRPRRLPRSCLRGAPRRVCCRGGCRAVAVVSAAWRWRGGARGAACGAGAGADGSGGWQRRGPQLLPGAGSNLAKAGK